jgi:tRNA threonylcarbamoyladenosine biosynthesis protein TsaB
MIILGLDSSGNSLSVALLRDGDIIANRSDFRYSSQAETLIPTIQEILFDLALDYKDIDYLCLTAGPGSFTGVRVGISYASAIKIATDIKIISFSTLEIVAYKMINQSRFFDYYIVIMHASVTELFIQIFDPNNNPISEIILININSLIDYVKHLDGQIALGGSGLYNIESIIREYNKTNITYFPRFSLPQAQNICKRAYSLISENKYINESLSPIYIRKPDAKIGKNSNLL